MEYLFVHDKDYGGWWLKIDNVDQLIDYHQKTSSWCEGALNMYLNGKSPQNMSFEERMELTASGDKDWQYLQAALIMAERNKGTILDGFRGLIIEAGMSELKNIQKYGACYFNCVGGHTFGVEYDMFCRRKELVFPNYNVSDIRIKQFENGEHFYAYIGDTQVKDKYNNMKWNTRNEAYEAAYASLRVNMAS